MSTVFSGDFAFSARNILLLLPLFASCTDEEIFQGSGVTEGVPTFYPIRICTCMFHSLSCSWGGGSQLSFLGIIFPERGRHQYRNWKGTSVVAWADLPGVSNRLHLSLLSGKTVASVLPASGKLAHHCHIINFSLGSKGSLVYSQ